MSEYENRAELLVDGDVMSPSLLADIRAARATVHISIFLCFGGPIDDEPFAKRVLEAVRDVDIEHSHRVAQEDVTRGLSGFRTRHRDPRTLYLYSQCVL